MSSPGVVFGRSTALRLFFGRGGVPLVMEWGPSPTTSTWQHQHHQQQQQELVPDRRDQRRCQRRPPPTISSPLVAAIPFRLVYLHTRLFSTFQANQDDNNDNGDLCNESSFDDDDDDDHDDLSSVAATAAATAARDDEEEQQRQQQLGPNPGLASIVEQGLPSLEKVAVHLQYQTRRVQSIPIATTTTKIHPAAVPTIRRQTLRRPANDVNNRNEEEEEEDDDDDDERSLTKLSLLPPEMTLSSRHSQNYSQQPPQHLADPRQHAEARRILDTATDCLEELAMRQPQQARRAGLVLWGGGSATDDHEGGGEPIVLLECVVNRNVRQAKLYWTLPYTLLLDERLTHRQYRRLVELIQHELVHGGGRGGRPGGGGGSSGAKLLARQVHAKLSSYYPPRIKLLPATDEMVQRVMEEFISVR